MSKTVWTKIVKEGFQEFTDSERGSKFEVFRRKHEGFTNENDDNISDENTSNGNTSTCDASSGNVYSYSGEVANFGNDLYIGKDANEGIIMRDLSKPLPLLTETDPSNNDTKSTISNVDQIKEIFNKFDANKAKNMYMSGISKIKSTISGLNGNIAAIIASMFYNTFESPEAKKDLAILSFQISTWIAVIPMSYLLVINWWYIMAYSNYVIDFREYICTIVHWPMSPALNAFELLNYYTLTFRMDVNATFPSIETSRKWIWNYRPIWFSLFHSIVFGSLMLFPIADILESTMMNSGFIFMIASIVSIYYFVTLFVQEKWYEKFITPFTIVGLLLLVGMTIISFLLMFAFVGIICPVFLIYILFLSYFVIFAFNGFWPPSVMSVCNQIFQELKEAPINDPIDKWGKLKNAAFQNFHSIYLLFIMIGIFMAHFYQAMSFSSNSLIVIAIIANLVICTLFAPSAFSVPLILLNIFLDDANGGSDKTVEPGETPIN